MSYVLLCEGRASEKPYLLADLRKKIYTIEELCFYIYQNASLCGEELMKSELVDWLGAQCGYVDLRESINVIMKNDPRPERIASQIFAYANYLTKQEREAVCERIRKYSLLSIMERKKMRADTSVVDGNYQDAIRDYEDILSGEFYRSEKEKHNIIYNIGCCYGNLFYYSLAYEWFVKAAELEENPKEDMISALFCKYMELSNVDFEDFLNKNPQMKEVAPVLQDRIGKISKEFRQTDCDDETKEDLVSKIKKLKTEV